MLAVSSVFADQQGHHPPIVMVHGAASDATVWRFWQHELAARGWTSHAIDLRGHGQSGRIDLSWTTMDDYTADVLAVTRQLAHTPVIMGWSMGGLVAMMVAATGDSVACVALGSSVPARQRNPLIALRTGEFDALEYGIVSTNPEAQPEMVDLDTEERKIALGSLGRESRLARAERKAGIVIKSISCPLLIVTGTADTTWPQEQYNDLWLDAGFHSVDGASHWGLVLNRRALAGAVPAVLSWLSTRV